MNRPVRTCNGCGEQEFAGQMVVDMRSGKALCKQCAQATAVASPKLYNPHECPVCGLLILSTFDDYEVAVVRFNHTRGYCQMPVRDYREYKAKNTSEGKCR